MNARELDGIFQIEHNTSFVRLLWIVLASISLSIFTYGVLAVGTNLSDFSQDVRFECLEIVLMIVLLLIMPAVIFIIGLIKIVKKTGIYLAGVRVANKGIEIGTFTLDANLWPPKKLWENSFIIDDTLGEWKQTIRFDNNTINILIVLRKINELPVRFLLERIIVSSRGKCLFQMLGQNSTGTQWNNICALVQGSLHLLGTDDGIYPCELSSFRERTANIVSKWKPSFVLSCTMKTIPRLANLDNVLAFGGLGGIGTTGVTNSDDKESQEIIFDNLNNEKKSLVDFNLD
jgi:hypothetical protein